jgi:hypothetical protein
MTMRTHQKLALGLGAALAMLLIPGASPADAKPPAHAPAWGYRAKNKAAVHPVRHRVVSRYGANGDFDRDGIRNSRDRDIDGDGIPNYRDSNDYRYDRRTVRRTVRRTPVVARPVVVHRAPVRPAYRTKKDWDRDGVRNKYDRDRDNDGVVNRADRDKDGDGRRNSKDDAPKNPRRR